MTALLARRPLAAASLPRRRSLFRREAATLAVGYMSAVAAMLLLCALDAAPL